MDYSFFIILKFFGEDILEGNVYKNIIIIFSWILYFL